MSRNKKPRNKKYNKVKSAEKQCDHLLKGKLIALKHTGDGQPLCGLIDMDGNEISVHRSTLELISRVKHQWSILIAGCCVDSNGRLYTKSEHLFFKERYFHGDLAEMLNKKHKEFIAKNCNQNHLRSAAWLASSVPIDFDEEKATDIFHKIGAFE